MMSKKMKSAVSLLLCASMVCCASLPAFAAAPAAPSSAPKEEVVYGILNPDGSVSEIYVVNAFRVDEAGTIVDYGDYTEVLNLNTQAPIRHDGQKVTIEADAGDLYCQGTLATHELPWKISIRYFLNSREHSAQELAGQTGALEIRITIEQNTRVSDVFFDEFALQANVTLDGEKCRDIEADGATVANVGGDKQISYTILPGTEKDITIRTDVSDFEMDPISINGIHLALDLDIDDEEPRDRVDELMAGIRDLDDGAGELSNGAGELNDGIAELQDGVNTLNGGVATMRSGLDTLNANSGSLTSGSAEVLAALRQIDAALEGMNLNARDLTALVNASAAIQAGIGELATGAAALQAGVSYDTFAATLHLGELAAANDAAIAALAAVPPEDPNYAAAQAAIGTLRANSTAIAGSAEYFGGLSGGAATLASGATALNEQYAVFHQTIVGMADAMGALPQNLTTLKAGLAALLSQYGRLDSGIRDYTDGVADLVAGYSELEAGAADLADGCRKLADGGQELLDGCGELTDGTAELREKTEEAEAEINEKIDEIVGMLGGEEGEPASFASPDNQNIRSVQFVLRTSAIEVPEAEKTAEAEEVEPTLWQKIKNLF